MKVLREDCAAALEGFSKLQGAPPLCRAEPKRKAPTALPGGISPFGMPFGGAAAAGGRE